MNVFFSMLIGMVATALTFGCGYALNAIPFFERSFPTPVLIAAAVVIFLAVIILSSRRNPAISIPSFLLLWPLLLGGIQFFTGVGDLFALSKAQYIVAAVGGVALVLIYQLIVNAIDEREHPIASSLTESFFVALIIGAYFLLKLLVTVDFATVAAHLSFVLLYSTSVAGHLGRESY